MKKIAIVMSSILLVSMLSGCLGGSGSSDVKLGDLNSDGKITQDDKKILSDYLLGNLTKDLDENQRKAADLNEDQKVNAKDETILLRYLEGKIKELPAKK